MANVIFAASTVSAPAAKAVRVEAFKAGATFETSYLPEAINSFNAAAASSRVPPPVRTASLTN